MKIREGFLEEMGSERLSEEEGWEELLGWVRPKRKADGGEETLGLGTIRGKNFGVSSGATTCLHIPPSTLNNS